MSPHLYRLLNQNLGMGILGGRRKKGAKCPKGTKMKKVSFKACRKGKGVLLGGCECCMGQGCMNCMGMSGMGILGGRKRNNWVACLKKLHNVKKCKSQKMKGYPVLKRKSPSKAKRKHMSQGLSDYQMILRELRQENPTADYRMLQKDASKIYQSGQY